MYKIGLSPLAERDLEEIWLYTCKKWSYQQADKYLDDLHNGCAQLSAIPNLDTPVDNIRQGYRKLQIGRHLIFYRILEETKAIHVVRILHERMDLARRL